MLSNYLSISQKLTINFRIKNITTIKNTLYFQIQHNTIVDLIVIKYFILQQKPRLTRAGK
jgi:hypothetical protein